MPSVMETSSTRLEVDEVILDYLLWYCTSALLFERKNRTDEAARNADLGIKLAHNFYQTFQRLHPHILLPEPIVLRLRTCRFAAMLLRRVDITSSDFAPNGPARHRRAQSWLRRRNIPSVLSSVADSSSLSAFFTPYPPTQIQRNAAAALSSLGHHPGSLYGSATLRDVMWEFLMLTTHISARISEVNGLWMKNMVEFMQHAVLEAYRCDGCVGVHAVNEAFSVGLTEMPDFGEDISAEELAVNELFGGNDGAIGSEFEVLRREGLMEIIPLEGVSLQSHFEALVAENRWPLFEEGIVNYLISGEKCQSRPVLAQLEQGRLEGFDTREVQAVLASAGVSGEIWR